MAVNAIVQYFMGLSIVSSGPISASGYYITYPIIYPSNKGSVSNRSSLPPVKAGPSPVTVHSLYQHISAKSASIGSCAINPCEWFAV